MKGRVQGFRAFCQITFTRWSVSITSGIFVLLTEIHKRCARVELLMTIQRILEESRKEG